MEKGIVYLRISTSKQMTDAQRYAIDNYSKKNSIEIVKVFDEQVSGATEPMSRMVYNELINYLEKNKDVNHFLIYEVSRIGRNMKDVLTQVDYFTSKGISIHLVKDNKIYSNNPDSKFSFHINTAVGEFERALIAARTKNGKDEAVLIKNHWHGSYSVIYGYSVIDKMLVVNDEEAEIIKFIFEQKLKKESNAQIARELNLKGVLTRMQKNGVFHAKRKGVISNIFWKPSSIDAIISNRAYIGERYYKGETLIIPAIIDTDIWEMAQTIKLKQGRKEKKEYFLSGVKLKCGVCNRTISPKNYKEKYKYKCQSQRVNDDCGNTSISINKVNEAVLFIMNSIGSLININQQLNGGEDYEQKISIIENKIEELNKKNNIILRKEKESTEALINGYGNRETIISSLKIYKEDLLSIKNEIKTLNKQKIDFLNKKENQKTSEAIFNNLSDNHDVIKNTIKQLIEKIVFYPVSLGEKRVSRFSQKEVKIYNNNYFKVLYIYLKGIERPQKICICSRQSLIYFINDEYDETTHFLNNWSNHFWKETNISEDGLKKYYQEIS